MLRKSILWLTSASVLLVTGCAVGPRPLGIKLRQKTRFETEWIKYVDLASFKAIAVAGELGAVYVSGYAHAAATQAAAVDEARRRCEERRADKRIPQPCRIYAVGDEIVEAPPP